MGGDTDLTNFIIKVGVDKNVATSDGLSVENNVQIHISPLNYMCERCGDKFETNYKLTRHKITHETNHYKCGECDFVTISEKYLWQHNRNKHTGNERKFICEKCGTKYKYKQSLTEHYLKCDISVLNGQLMKCDDCGKVFARKSSLDQHREIHNEKTYQCTLCDYKSYREWNVKIHVKHSHLTKKYFCATCKK